MVSFLVPLGSIFQQVLGRDNTETQIGNNDGEKGGEKAGNTGGVFGETGGSCPKCSAHVSNQELSYSPIPNTRNPSGS